MEEQELVTITFEEAKLLVRLSHPKMVPVSVVDFGDHFVFVLGPQDNPNEVVYDSMSAVNKTTGEITGFQPMALPDPDSYFEAAKKAVKLI